MKKFLLLLFVGFVGIIKSNAGAVFTSVQSGNYSVTTTWSIVGFDVDGLPDLNDDVIISAGHTVTLSASVDAKSLTINPGGVFSMAGFSMLVWGNLTNNGSSIGNGTWQFLATGTYSGNPINNFGTMYFYTNYTIAPGVVLNKGGGITVSSGATVSNNGSITLTSSGILNVFSNGTWKNNAGSSLNVSANVINSGTIDCSANANTFTYSTPGYTQIMGTNATYFNLVLTSPSASAKALTANLTVLGNLTISANVTLNCANHNINIGGNWNNNANTSCFNRATVNFNGSGTQIITRAATEIFTNLTLSGTGTVQLARDINVLGTTTLTSGTLDPSTFTYHQKGASWLGNGGLINTGAVGKVMFDGGIAQSIAGTAGTTFGNLEISDAGFTVSLGHDQTVSGTTTLTAGTLDVSTFIFHQKGASWLANGASINTAAAGTIAFDGAVAQTIGGTIGADLGNVQFNDPGFTTTILFNQNVKGSTTLTAGTLDVGALTYHQQGANWNGNGGFLNNASTGIVTFDGVVAQTIGGTTGTAFRNLTINNASGVSSTASNSLIGIGVLTMNAGTFTSAAVNFTFISDATGTARIATIVAGGFAGTKWVCQRFVGVAAPSNNTPYWDNFTSPVSGSTLADWDGAAHGVEMYLSGVSGNDGNAVGQNGIFRSVRKQTGSVTTNVTTVATALGVGAGFEIWTANTLNTFTGLLFDSRGTPNFGTKVVACPNGYDDVGNPYMSPVLWSALGRVGVSNQFFILDETLQNYAVWNGATGTGKLNGSGGVINSSQGILVLSAGAGTLTFTEAAKSAAATTFVRMAPEENMLTIHLSRADGQSLGAENIIAFNDVAFDNKDETDANALVSPNENSPYMRTLSSDGSELFINSRSSSSESHSVPLDITYNLPGEYILSFRGLENMNAYDCVFLEDVASGQFINLKSNPEYHYVSNTSGEEKHYIVHFDHKILLANGIEGCAFDERISNTNTTFTTDIFAADNGLNLNFHFDNLTPVTVSVFDIAGREVLSSELSVAEDHVVLALPETHGVYIVELISNGQKISKQIYR